QGNLRHDAAGGRALDQAIGAGNGAQGVMEASSEYRITRAAHSVRSPPPCGEGLGVGVRQRIAARPPPRRSAAKLAQAAQACLRAPTLPTRGRVGPSLPLAL